MAKSHTLVPLSNFTLWNGDKWLINLKRGEKIYRRMGGKEGLSFPQWRIKLTPCRVYNRPLA